MRISRHHMFMQIAEVAAMRSTCERGNVGAVLVYDHDIVCMGYNGPPSGEPHCQGNDCGMNENGGCLRSIHAERNAIERAYKKNGFRSLYDHYLYTTYSPCLDCAKRIADSRINKCFYRYAYRDTSGLDYLSTLSWCRIYRLTPAGYVIIPKNGRILNGDEDERP